jgi:hypothetical protein
MATWANKELFWQWGLTSLWYMQMQWDVQCGHVFLSIWNLKFLKNLFYFFSDTSRYLLKIFKSRNINKELTFLLELMLSCVLPFFVISFNIWFIRVSFEMLLNTVIFTQDWWYSWKMLYSHSRCSRCSILPFSSVKKLDISSFPLKLKLQEYKET